MRVLAVNGSARKGWNTEIILNHALEGVKKAAPEAETELVSLFPMKFSGCVGCMACKKKGAVPGNCVINDELTPLLQKANEADAVILGTPVYFFSQSGAMRCLLERFIFPWMDYASTELGTRHPRGKSIATIYTMNVTGDILAKHGFQNMCEPIAFFAEQAFGHCEIMWVCDTQQVEDYSKYDLNFFDAEKKYESRKERFPADCRKAGYLGEMLAKRTRALLAGTLGCSCSG